MSKFHFTIQRNQPDQFDRWPARAPHWIIYAENGLPVKDVHDVTTGQALEQLQTTVMEQAQEIRTLRFALNQMMPDYVAFIEDAADHGADKTWVEECWQIAAYARAALQPKEGKG